MEEKAMTKLIHFPSSYSKVSGGKYKAGKHSKNGPYSNEKITNTSENLAAQNKIIIALSQETIRNLLVSRIRKRKSNGLNNDGVIEISSAQFFVFPSLNAPEAVKTAWDKTIANLTDQEKASAKTAFLELQLKVNTYIMPNGAVRIISPGEPEYRNIFTNNSSRDYLSLIDEAIDILNISIKYYDAMEKENIRDVMAILKIFKANLLSMISCSSYHGCS
jgi:hypothetical protein